MHFFSLSFSNPLSSLHEYLFALSLSFLQTHLTFLFSCKLFKLCCLSFALPFRPFSFLCHSSAMSLSVSPSFPAPPPPPALCPIFVMLSSCLLLSPVALSFPSFCFLQVFGTRPEQVHFQKKSLSLSISLSHTLTETHTYTF